MPELTGSAPEQPLLNLGPGFKTIGIHAGHGLAHLYIGDDGRHMEEEEQAPARPQGQLSIFDSHQGHDHAGYHNQRLQNAQNCPGQWLHQADPERYTSQTEQEEETKNKNLGHRFSYCR